MITVLAILAETALCTITQTNQVTFCKMRSTFVPVNIVTFSDTSTQ